MIMRWGCLMNDEEHGVWFEWSNIDLMDQANPNLQVYEYNDIKYCFTFLLKHLMVLFCMIDFGR